MADSIKRLTLIDAARRNSVRARTLPGFLTTASNHSLFGASFLISFFLLSGGNRSFVLFFFHLVVRCGIEGAEFYPAMQDKTRITPVLARVL